MNGLMMNEVLQARVSEVAHIAEQESMYATIVASAERAERWVERRRRVRARIVAAIHFRWNKSEANRKSEAGRGSCAEPADA